MESANMAKGRGDTVEKLFSPKRQYEIPIYQRRYVWGIENWNDLWTDIQGKFDSRISGKQSTSHFTGIIITRKDEKAQGLPKYQILDGQQRLTTFQIILCVIRDLCQSESYTLRADSADLLVKNKGYNEKYKLYPKEGFDEIAFRALVDSEPRGDHVMHHAYKHFMDAITDDIGTKLSNIDHLYDAITNDFHMVQIDLKKGDEPEKIFASLNATGRMLDEFDHLRNDLFLKAGEAGDNLYRKCWSHFDTDSYWENPENLDIFLKHFLQATVASECFQNQDGHDIKAFDVYLKQYRPKLKPDQDIKYEFRKLEIYSKVYQEMNNPDSKIGSRMKFYKDFDIEGMFPFILFIIGEFSEFPISEDEYQRESLLSDNDLDLIFDILESYMMRRMLRWGRDHNYKSIDMINSFFNNCLNERTFSLPKFITHLANRRPDQHQDKWSTDPEVNVALTEEWHDHITKGILYILYRIEGMIREEKNKSTIDFTDSHRLERIMPTKWENNLNWQLPIEENSDRCVPYDNMFTEEHKKNNRSWRKVDPSEEGLVDQTYLYALDLAKSRRKTQKSIGNLTFVDVEIETDDFAEKKTYLQNFPLEINEIIYDSENWDAPQIEKRTEKLLPYFHKLWPSSEDFMDTYLSRKYPIDSNVQGKVVNITNSGVTIRLEEGVEGWIPKNEITWTPHVDISRIVNKDDEIRAIVTRIVKPKDTIRIWLSMKPFLIEPWTLLEQEYHIGSEVTGIIRKITYHGVYVEIEDGITGKIDYSKFSWLNDRIAKTFLSEGEKVDVIIQEIDPSKGKISLNFKQTPQNPWEQIEKKYTKGAEVKGCIRSITDYGAFVEIEDGIDGLLHNTELSWTKQCLTAKECFEEGEEVEIIIKKIDVSKQRITLSRKLEPNPWESIEQEYSIGRRITGYIRKLTKAGAYVETKDFDGLIRNLDISWTNRKVAARDYLKVDEEVEVVILEIDTSEQRVHLGFKQLQPNPWEQIEKKYSIGSVVKGHVQNIDNFGAFVEIEDGIDGFIHISELTDQEIEKPEDAVSVGQELEMKVIQISSKDERIELSLKAMIDEELNNQPRWISMIESQTTWFTTYRGRKKLSDVEVREFDVIGLNSNGINSNFNIKQDILFGYSEEAYSKLVYHITKRIPFQEQKSEQIQVPDVTLNAAQNIQSIVTATVHSGHELTGIIKGSDKEAIYMQINNETVIVFRHSICDFKTE